MKSIFSLACILVIGISCSKPKEGNPAMSNSLDSVRAGNLNAFNINSTQDSFIISTFHGVPGTVTPYYQQILENTKLANFTHFETTFTSPSGSLEALRIAEELGLKVIIQDYSRFGGFQNYPAQIANTTTASVAEAVAMYGAYESFAGYFVWDEPFMEQLPQAKADLDLLKLADPDKLFLIVTLQSYSPSYTWENGQYTAYIDSVLSIVKPPLLTTDYYVFERDIDNGVALKDSKLWKDWGYIRKRAYEEGIPFWLYTQLMGDIPGNAPGNMTVPKVAVQNYSALALGAKGISYYNSINGIFDDQGTPNSQYQGVKELNKEISVIGNKLLNTTPVLVYPTMGLLHGEYLHVMSQSELVNHAPEGLLIGEFRRAEDNATYLLVVNIDYQQPHSGSIQLDAVIDLFLIDKEDGDEQAVTSNTSVVNFDLLPGRGALYLLK